MTAAAAAVLALGVHLVVGILYAALRVPWSSRIFLTSRLRVYDLATGEPSMFNRAVASSLVFAVVALFWPAYWILDRTAPDGPPGRGSLDDGLGPLGPDRRRAPRGLPGPERGPGMERPAG